jgi:Domain of unknown function (DUF1707)
MNTTSRDFPSDDMRVSDADRDRAIAELNTHFQAGRLTMEEYDERSGRALQARTGRDLTALFTDLPGGPGSAGGLGSAGSAGNAGSAMPSGSTGFPGRTGFPGNVGFPGNARFPGRQGMMGTTGNQGGMPNQRGFGGSSVARNVGVRIAIAAIVLVAVASGIIGGHSHHGWVALIPLLIVVLVVRTIVFRGRGGGGRAGRGGRGLFF